MFSIFLRSEGWDKLEGGEGEDNWRGWSKTKGIPLLPFWGCALTTSKIPSEARVILVYSGAVSCRFHKNSCIYHCVQRGMHEVFKFLVSFSVFFLGYNAVTIYLIFIFVILSFWNLAPNFLVSAEDKNIQKFTKDSVCDAQFFAYESDVWY